MALRLANGHPTAVCSDQVLPFQLSASGDTAPVTVALLKPTAEQKVGEVHDTERRALNVAGLGVATMVQVVPFHWAATVVSAVTAAFWSSPTAMQFVAEMHDTELSSTRSPDVPGFGTLRVVQVPPVHSSAGGGGP
jgi:hypothetical protein